MKNRVVIVGLDGADWALAKRWIRQGHLPALQHIEENGISGELCSTVPPLSPPAWATFMTGKYPAKHGIYAFEKRVGDRYESMPANGSHLRSETLAEIVSRHGRRAIQINVPMTFPPRPINGIWVSGLDTPTVDSTFSFPEHVAPELVRSFGYDIEPKATYGPGEEESVLESVTTVEQNRARAVLHLLQSESWDLYCVVFRGIDILSHFFWRFMDTTHPCYDKENATAYGNVILDHYQAMDRVIGQVMQQTSQDTTLFVVSDHGFGPHLRWIYLDNLFIDLGLLRLCRSETAKTKRLFLSALLKSELAALIRAILPLQVRSKIGKRIADSVSAVDWEHSAVYPTYGQGLVRLNVYGRDPRGCVRSDAECKRIVNLITEQVMDLRDPITRERVAERVLAWQEVYPCSSDDSPDLWIEWKAGYMAKKDPPPTTDRFSEYCAVISGNHRREGVLFAQGPDLSPGVQLANTSIADITPTVLHLLGLPVPGDMDGHVLMNALRDGTSAAIEYEEPVPYTGQPAEHVWSDKDRDIVEKRLADLGYL
ncbi:MAG: alkaline phosphatase family protein [Anaerolineae bacterium]|nr:alkaline phosphatase family protein [Anaerolineae bacterium]